MSKLITTEDQIRQILPNQIVTVKGEASLLDKLLPFIDISERWVVDTFLGDDVFELITNGDKHLDIFNITASLVVADAMRQAIPVLDVVITPNGFATVGTQNLVAASKARVDKLVEAMVGVRDTAIGQLLKMLPSVTCWCNSPQAEFFSSTLFAGFDILLCLNIVDNKWDQYLKIRAEVMSLESSLADDFISHELLNALHQEVFAGNINNNMRKVVVTQLKNQIAHRMTTGNFDLRKLNNIVNFIRINPVIFPEWHTSELSGIYNPPIFKNKKSATGYFF